MSKEQGLQFKPFVPRLVEALEDADGVVRETAKMAVVELFRYAPSAHPFHPAFASLLIIPLGPHQDMLKPILRNN
jgi:CLASP N terminal